MVDLADPDANRDLTERPDWQEWSGRILDEVIPNLERSRVTMILYAGTHEPKQALEIGYAVLLGKPIVVAYMPGQEPPWGLKKVANYIIEADTSTEESKASFARKLAHATRGL